MERSRNHPEPWARFLASHKAGDELEGTVTSVVPFGAFVELTDGVDGLVHVSEMEEQLSMGETLRVKVLDIDEESRRISLTPARNT